MDAQETQKEEDDFADTPEDQARRWSMELEASKDAVESWRKDAEEVLKSLKDKDRPRKGRKTSRWKLYAANVKMKRSLLYGKTPKVDVARRYEDAADDDARAGAELMDRMLNEDIERQSDGFPAVLDLALMDRLVPGLACMRWRYEADVSSETVEAKTDKAGKVLAEGYEKSSKKSERVEAIWVYWKDHLWSAGAKCESDIRWKAYGNEMSRKDLVKRFGEEIGNKVPLNSKRGKRFENSEAMQVDPWARAYVWEIWSLEDQKVYWYVEGFGKILDTKEDPLGLECFFPGPPCIFANTTTDELMPSPDYFEAADLYEEIDEVSTRIRKLIRAAKLVGLYDKSAGEAVGRALGEATENQLVPVENWAIFAEKGGIKGVIEFFPLEQVVATVNQLREYRTELISATYQLDGMNDIMRGQAAQTDVTATEQSLKARFASVRMQALQDEFAKFATDALRIKAEIIAKHFSPETILQCANAQFTFDAQLAPRAVQLIKSEFAQYRIQVRSENLSMTDFAQLKAERVEFLTSLSSFIQAAAPLAQAMPGAMSFLLKILQWTMAGLKGSSSIEGVLDQAVAAASQAQQQQAMQPQIQQPDPKLMAAQMKGQQDAQKIQLQTQSEMMRIDKETQALADRRATDAAWSIKEDAAKQRMKAAVAPPPRPPPGGIGP